MDKHTLEVLEFGNIVDEVTAYCRTEEGKTFLREQKHATDKEEHEIGLQQAVDMRRILESGEKEPDLTFPPVEHLLPLVEKEGSVLEPAELLGIALFLNSSISFGKYISRWLDSFPESPLSAFFPLPHVNEVIREIYFYFEKDGKIKEKNVPELKRISRTIGRVKQDIQDLVQKYLKNTQFREFWQTDVPAQRSSRTVLPLKAQYKNRIKGIVHEVSSTGATLFVEPYEVVEKNNSLAEKENEYKAEVHRILRRLSELIRNRLHDIRMMVGRIAALDSLYGKSKYSSIHRCVQAESIDKGVRLIKARHPLLGKECVPIDLEIKPDINILIISGPNTGGKTVTLKTAGLLALMNQFGMEIPAAEGTAMPLFSSILVDIGDEQSIKESLSTFSAHLARLSEFHRQAEKSSLVLLDELGAGTDAEEGSALAMALLDSFLEKKCIVLTTTHQNLLKSYAASSPQAENASVDFNADTFQPTYRLTLGFPGESHAIDIAQKNGLPQDIISRAVTYLKTGKTDVSKLIKELNEKNRELMQRDEELASREEEVAQQAANLEEEKRTLAVREIELKKEGIRSLKALLSESRKTLENLVRKVKETNASPETVREVKDFLSAVEETSVEEGENLEKEEALYREAPEEEISEGSLVKIKSTGKTGTVIRRGKRGAWVIETGSVKIEMKAQNLTPVTALKKESPRYDTAGITPSSEAVFQLDLRGYRLEEALEVLEKQIDSCLISGMYEFSVIHGFGEGVLQNGVHRFLRSSPVVADFHFAHPDQGGFGKTHVSLSRG